MHWIRAAAIGGATLALILGTTPPGFAQSKLQSAMPQAQKTKIHRVVVQVTQNDPAVMKTWR